MSKIGVFFKIAPISEITGLVIENVIKSEQFEQFISSQVHSKLSDYVLYVPQSFKLGSDQTNHK